MEKYSQEWKRAMQEKHGGWAQKTVAQNGDKVWRWHFIQLDTEFCKPENYYTAAECERENKA